MHTHLFFKYIYNEMKIFMVFNMHIYIHTYVFTYLYTQYIYRYDTILYSEDFSSYNPDPTCTLIHLLQISTFHNLIEILCIICEDYQCNAGAENNCFLSLLFCSDSFFFS